MTKMRGRNNKTVAGQCIAIILLGLVTVVGSGSGGGGGGSSNTAPVASDVCDNTPLNMDLTGDLNSSVTDPDSPVLSFSLSILPGKGTATVDVTGTFNYTPNVNARGADSFGYVVDDLSGGQDAATVTVIIGKTRIMPLGDSITTGTGELSSPNRVGYREKLFTDLDADGYMVDFVGSFTEPTSPSFDADHEGHPGFEDGQVATMVFTWLTDNAADVVLLHIGTNPAVIDTDPGDVETILDQIDLWVGLNNSVTVFLARIIDRNPHDLDVKVYNANVVNMVQARTGDTIIIVIVDQHAALGPPDMSDDLHPNAAGYNKMAVEWRNELTSSGAIPRCP